MRSIPLLAVNATDVFDEIATAKRQPRRQCMLAVRARVLAAYENYEGAVPEVGGLAETQMTDLQKESMRHAFTVETVPMTRLRGDLLKRVSVARCPFCGISESSTLDHYLPKEQYQERHVRDQIIAGMQEHAHVRSLVQNAVSLACVANRAARNEVFREH